MNLLGSLVVLIILLIIVNRAYGAEVYETIRSAVDSLAAALVIGAALGSSVAVVFNYGEETKRTLKRAFVSFVSSIATAPFAVEYLGFGGFFAWQATAFVIGALSFVVLETFYSQAFRKALQSVITRGSSK